MAEDSFTVEGERRLEEEEKKHNWYTAEQDGAGGKFVGTGSRCPAGINPADVKATFENGVLEVAVAFPATAVTAPRKVESQREEEGRKDQPHNRFTGHAVPRGPRANELGKFPHPAESPRCPFESSACSEISRKNEGLGACGEWLPTCTDA